MPIICMNNKDENKIINTDDKKTKTSLENILQTENLGEIKKLKQEKKKLKHKFKTLLTNLKYMFQKIFPK